VQNLPVPLDRRVWMECQALVSTGRYEVSVICPKGPGDESYEYFEGVHLHKYTPPPLTSGVVSYLFEFIYCWLRTADLAVRVFMKRPFRVIQACNPPDTYFALAAPFKLLGVKFVYDQHDLCPEMLTSRFGHESGPLMLGLRALELATYKLADRVISTNESYAQVAVERGRLDRALITVVRSGPDPETMRRNRTVAQLRRGRQHLTCWLGVMGPQDGVDVALRAVHHYTQVLGRTDCHFAFMGFGDAYADLRMLAIELGIESYIEFTGRVGPDQIEAYLSTADLGLVPDPWTRYADLSTHNKTLEYMSFEVPVLSTDLQETRRSAGEAAVYVASGDPGAFALAIRDLLDNPSERARMGSEGRRKVVDELGWPHQRDRYVSVFDALTKRVNGETA